MKLRAEQLEQQLSQNPQRIYMLSGDEQFLLDELRQAFKQLHCDETIRLLADSKFKWQELLTITNNPSLFSSHRLVELSIPTGKPGQEGSKTLIQYCQNPADDVTLVIMVPKLTQQQMKAKWVESINNAGTIVQVWPLDSKQLPQWLRQRMRDLGLQTTPEGYQLLAEKVEGNLLAAKQELEKLRLCFGEGCITTEQMIEAVSDHCRFNVFNLTDALTIGDAKKALQILQGLQAEGHDAILTLWAITREIRTLLQVKTAVNHGETFQAACFANQVWSQRQPLVQKAIQRLNQATLATSLTDALLIDKIIKGRAKGDPWLQLQTLCFKLCGKAIFA